MAPSANPSGDHTTEGDTTEGHLLGGRLRYAQPLRGFRTGIEPVFLAAAIPARPGQRVLEAGTGAGAALLCLAHRLPGVNAVGVERDPVMAALARRNINANALAVPPTIIEADITAGADAASALGRFDHACANPPWHRAGGTGSADMLRAAAKSRGPDLLVQWTSALAGRLRPRGTLTLILSAAALPDGIAALAAARCGAITLLPLWPRRDEAARIVLVQGIAGSAGPGRLQPGLILHQSDGRYTEAADSIMRGGAPLPFSLPRPGPRVQPIVGLG